MTDEADRPPELPFTKWIQQREEDLLGSSGNGNPWRADCETEAIGLALSGGGIRSAAYCLGVMQTLVQHGWLKHIDYLSTVSGGGYIGTALDWYLRHHFQTEKKWRPYGTHHEDFPFETEYGLGVLAAQMSVGPAPEDAAPAPAQGPDREEVEPDGPPPRGDRDLRRLEPLRVLRHSGRTMTPGGGLDNAAFIAVMLRAVCTSVLTYGAIMILIGAFLHSALFTLGGVPLPGAAFDSVVPIGFGQRWAAPGAIWLAVAVGTLAPMSWLARRLRPGGQDVDRHHDIFEGIVLKVAALFMLIGSLPMAVHGINVVETRVGLGGATEAVVGAFSAITGILGALGIFSKSNSSRSSGPSLKVVAPVAAALTVYGVLLFSFWASAPETGFVNGRAFGYDGGLLGYVVGCFPFVTIAVIGWFQDLNDVSPHRYYQDRLRDIFLPAFPSDEVSYLRPRAATSTGPSTAPEESGATTTADASADIDPGHLAAPTWRRPYHLLNTHVLAPSVRGKDKDEDKEERPPRLPSRRRMESDRGGDSYLLSPLFVGSQATGWTRTSDSVAKEMPLYTAMAASGAAAQPNAATGGTGLTRGRAVGLLMALLNLRMGYWVQDTERPRRPNLVWPGLRSVAPRWARTWFDGDRPWVELSDGAHFENLGVYELIRRRCRVIIVCDAGADPDFRFADLANLTEKVRSDFGTVLKVSGEDLETLVPEPSVAATDATIRPKYSQRGYILASIKYTRDAAEEVHGENDGVLVYLKTTFFAKANGLGLPPDVYGYKAENPSFPDQSTVDQFFDERQFEAYRELGFVSGFNLLRDFLAHDSTAEPVKTADETPEQKAVRKEWLLRQVVLKAIRERALYRRKGDAKEHGDFCGDPEAQARQTSLWAWPDVRTPVRPDLEEHVAAPPDP